jgi:hypothetical protein
MKNIMLNTIKFKNTKLENTKLQNTKLEKYKTAIKNLLGDITSITNITS